MQQTMLHSSDLNLYFNWKTVVIDDLHSLRFILLPLWFCYILFNSDNTVCCKLMISLNRITAKFSHFSYVLPLHNMIIIVCDFDINVNNPSNTYTNHFLSYLFNLLIVYTPMTMSLPLAWLWTLMTYFFWLSVTVNAITSTTKDTLKYCDTLVINDVSQW